jgi:2-polyprenyl-3-methyl-5-hydroxy-6-metoxy-1,4-benzoquinol methylase
VIHISALENPQVPSINKVRSYWDRRPCNIRHSSRPIGTREYFEEVESRKHFVEPHILEFAEFERCKGKRVLEIGCGIGTATVCFARAGATVTAVDLSEESLRLARKRVELFDLKDRVRFFSGNAEDLDQILPKGQYDLIYSFGVVHHTPNPERILRHLRSYLAPGGELRVMVYHRFSWKVFWILLTYGKGKFWKRPELVAKHSEAETGCPVTYTYSKSEFSQLLASCGFRATDVKVDHIFPYDIENYVQYRYVRVWYFRWMPQWMFRQLERMLGWHLCVRAVSA